MFARAVDGAAARLQRRRVATQAAFFALFLLAPPLDLFRLDLTLGHFILFGHSWTLGLADFQAGRIGAGQAALNLLLRAFLPLFALAALLLGVAWRYGRLYCGWLCPHFTVVETINRLMRRAIGRQSLWDRHRLPPRDPDGTALDADRRLWPLAAAVAVALAGVWAIGLLCYLLPPAQVWGNLIRGEPTRNQAVFLGVATLVFSIDFLFARHLFCRFGCAIGMFQSLAWMSHRGALVVGFERERGRDCASCWSACDVVCPMRLKPRQAKRFMFSCTQCGSCVAACDATQRGNPHGPLLGWIDGDEARARDGAQGLVAFERARVIPIVPADRGDACPSPRAGSANR